MRRVVLAFVIAGCVVPPPQQQPQTYPPQPPQAPQEQPQPYAQQPQPVPQPYAAHARQASCQDTLACYGQCNPLTQPCIDQCDSRTSPESQQNAHAVLMCISQSGCQDQNCVAQHCSDHVQACTNVALAQQAPQPQPQPVASGGEVMQAQYDEYGSLIIHPPARILTMADIAGDWSNDNKALSTYHSATGRFDGFSSTQVANAFNIDANGNVSQDFKAATVTGGANGIGGGVHAMQSHQTGKVTLPGNNTITFDYAAGGGRPARTERYIIVGWFVGPELVLMETVGPFYVPITQNDFNNIPHMMYNADIFMRRR